MQSTEFRAMNTKILLAAEGNSELVARGFGETEKYIHSAEARLTRFSETSELAALNRSSGNWFDASEDLFDLVREARDYFQETDGLFDPTIIDALEFAGYDKSMDDIRAQGSVVPPHSALIHTASSFRAVEFDDTRAAIRMPQGMRLDLGGIAKGWIAESAALLLADYAEACVVDAGGDLFAVGLPQGENAWQIEIEDPGDASATLGILSVGPGAVATSSITKRRWQQGDRMQHHLIDPRLGAPAETDWLAVTVIAPHTTTAEVFAKTLLIAGSREAQDITARRGDIAFIAVDRAGKLWGSQNSMEYLNGKR
jgi:thiamine biosynthesis lipoprotein